MFRLSEIKFFKGIMMDGEFKQNLTASQLAALQCFRVYAQNRKSAALATIQQILKMSDISEARFSEALKIIRNHARVVLHFHPDRLGLNLKTVAELLLEDGVYRNQFETLISNGSVSAHPGGDRDKWEQNLFGGAYSFDSCSSFERPKYGALDVLRHSDGPAPRFGSCYFVLRPEVTSRCTFTWLDSHENPPERGTLDEFEDIISALLKETFQRDYALGEFPITVSGLIARIEQLIEPLADPKLGLVRRALNHYIEAQVHGDVLMSRDIECLVADPSFENHEIGSYLRELSKKYQFDLKWHLGFKLPLERIPPDFRGPTMPSLARRITSNGVLLPCDIGTAAASVRRNPLLWSDRGTEKELLQELKLLWHLLSKFGGPAV